MRPSPPSQPGANHRSMAGGSSTHGGTCNSSRSNSALGSLLDIPFPNMMAQNKPMNMNISHPLAQDFSLPTVQNKTRTHRTFHFRCSSTRPWMRRTSRFRTRRTTPTRFWRYKTRTGTHRTLNFSFQVQPNKSTMNAPQDFPVSVQNKPMNMNISHPLAQDFPFLTVQITEQDHEREELSISGAKQAQHEHEHQPSAGPQARPAHSSLRALCTDRSQAAMPSLRTHCSGSLHHADQPGAELQLLASALLIRSEKWSERGYWMAFFYKNYSILNSSLLKFTYYTRGDHLFMLFVINHLSSYSHHWSSHHYFSLVQNNQNIPYPPTKSNLSHFYTFWKAFLQLFSSLFSTLPQNTAMMFLYTITLTKIILSTSSPHCLANILFVFDE